MDKLSQPPYVEILDLRKEFRGPGGITVALDRVNLSIARNSFTSIVGTSGCGKTTLLKTIAGLTHPTSGAIYIDGRAISSPPFQIIYVFQHYTKSLFPWKTVMENVSFGLENRSRLDRRSIREICAEYISLVGLTGFEKHYPWQLSGGMQQRVAVARALVCQPEALLMDEPFNSVDALTRSSLQDLLLRIWDELKLTVIFVTHDVEEATYLSDRVVVLSQAPATVADELEIKLSRPRHQIGPREDQRFLEYRRYIYDKISAMEGSRG